MRNDKGLEEVDAIKTKTLLKTLLKNAAFQIDSPLNHRRAKRLISDKDNQKPYVSAKISTTIYNFSCSPTEEYRRK